MDWKLEEGNVELYETCVGMFPLITNDSKLTMEEIQSAYPWPDMKSHLVKKNIQDSFHLQIYKTILSRIKGLNQRSFITVK
jgi:hypothetical protein